MSSIDSCYEIRNVANKGDGVFATRKINRNEVVMVGTLKEKLSGNHSHAAQVDIDQWAIFEGDIAIANHSCDPNIGIKLNETGGHDFVAFKPIEEGDEICLDYAMRNYQVEHFPVECACGASNCRKKITGYRDLPADRKDAYAGFVAPYLLKLKVQVESTADAL